VEPVFRRKVFERDGWRCQICGGRVLKSAKVPHPKAPTVDHIVPLAMDGDHSMANAQTAHFICNSEKGASARNDQLRLVG
jgi:5-methylcytosine-specific restriction endonuclease McrA